MSLLKRVIHKKKFEILLFDEVGYVFSRCYAYFFTQMFQELRLFKGLHLFRSLEYSVLLKENCNLDYFLYGIGTAGK